MADVIRPWSKLRAELPGNGAAGAPAGRRAEREAQAKLAVAALEDVRAVAGRRHPGAHQAGGAGQAAGAPGKVLAQRPAVVALDVARVDDAVDEVLAARRVMVE